MIGLRHLTKIPRSEEVPPWYGQRFYKSSGFYHKPQEIYGHIWLLRRRYWLRVPSNGWSWGRTIGYVKFCSIREGNEKCFQVDLWHFNNSDNLSSIQDMEDRLLWNTLILASRTLLVFLKEAGSPDPFLMQLEFVRCRKFKRSSTKTSSYQALMRT